MFGIFTLLSSFKNQLKFRLLKTDSTAYKIIFRSSKNQISLSLKTCYRNILKVIFLQFNILVCNNNCFLIPWCTTDRKASLICAYELELFLLGLCCVYTVASKIISELLQNVCFTLHGTTYGHEKAPSAAI